jgi:hypothetical protein
LGERLNGIQEVGGSTPPGSTISNNQFVCLRRPLAGAFFISRSERIVRLSAAAVAMSKSEPKQLVVCINNEGYPTSLERRKIYILLRDPVAEKRGLVRIIDESGDDYLYPKMLFRPIALPQSVKKAVLAAA